MSNLMIGDVSLVLNTESLHRSVHMAPKTRSTKRFPRCRTLVYTDMVVPADLKFAVPSFSILPGVVLSEALDPRR